MRGDVEMNVALKKRVSAVRWKLLQRLLQSAKNNTILATLWEQPLLREKKKTTKKPTKPNNQFYLASSGLEPDKKKTQCCNGGDVQWCMFADF